MDKSFTTIKLSPEMKAQIESSREEFIATFGRAPRPDEPMLWKVGPDGEPAAMTEDDVNDVMLNLLREIGAPGEVIYAFEQTGRLVTSQNRHLLNHRERRQWDGAIKDYRRRYPKG